MGTTTDKLNKLIQTKAAIKSAIETKGGTVAANATFASYANSILNIPSGGAARDWTLIGYTSEPSYIDTAFQWSVNNLAGQEITLSPDMYKHNHNLIWFPKNTTIKIVNSSASSAFREANMLQEIPDCTIVNVSGTQAYYCDGMFLDCGSLLYCDLKLTPSAAAFMFENCIALLEIPKNIDWQYADPNGTCIGTFKNTKNLTTITGLNFNVASHNTRELFMNSGVLQISNSTIPFGYRTFYGCTELTKIDNVTCLPRLYGSNITSANGPFYQCSNLCHIDLRDLGNSATFGGSTLDIYFTPCTYLGYTAYGSSTVDEDAVQGLKNMLVTYSHDRSQESNWSNMTLHFASNTYNLIQSRFTALELQTITDKGFILANG